MKNNYTLQKNNQERTPLKAAVVALLISLFCISNLSAQLAGWKYRDGITIQENAGVQNLNYQVLLNINTAALISANQMDVKGKDIRFSKDCGGSVLFNYYIDSLTINTANTRIWVQLDTLKANAAYTLYMWYGNSAAAAGSNFNATFPVSTQLIVSTGTITLTGANNYSWFEIKAGAGVNVTPASPLIINARMIRVMGTLNGNGAGFLGGTPGTNGSGPGAGTVSTGNLGTYGAGGAGYGGAGGQGGGAGAGANSATVGQGGISYGTLNTDSIDMGSGGGGAASGGQGGAGGAAITLIGNVIEIQGAVNANGSDGVPAVLNGAGGAGSGGGIRVKGNEILLSGALAANGGNGEAGGYGSGGGGGGRIKIFSDAAFVNTGTMMVAPGAAGPQSGETEPQAPGMIGTISTGTFTANEPTYTFIPHVILNSSPFPVCQGSPVVFVASGGFNPYNFYVNGASVQNSASNTYTTTSLATNDTVKVLASDVNGCVDTSNVIFANIDPLPSVTVSPTTTICIGSSTPLSASGGNTYTWSPPAGLSSTSGPSVSASPTVTTNYTVTVTDGNGCQNSDTVTVTVEGCTKLEHYSATDLQAYPNPNHGTLSIRANFATGKEVTLTLRDMLGETLRVIEHSLLSGNYKRELNIAELPAGVYFLVLKTNDGTTVHKIIKD